MLLISSAIELWFVKVVPKYLNSSTLSKVLLSILELARRGPKPLEMIRILVLILDSAVRWLRRQDVDLPTQVLGFGLMGLRFVSQETSNGGRFVCWTVYFLFQPNSMATLLHIHLSTGAVSVWVIWGLWAKGFGNTTLWREEEQKKKRKRKERKKEEGEEGRGRLILILFNNYKNNNKKKKKKKEEEEKNQGGEGSWKEEKEEEEKP